MNNQTKSDHNDKLRTSIAGAELSSQKVNYSANYFDDVFSRIMSAVGTTKAVDVANALEISQQSISGAKAKAKIPEKWLSKISDKYGVSTDWLRTGEGEMRRDGAKFAGVAQAREIVQSKTPSLMPPLLPLTHSPIQKPETLTCFDCELVMVPMVEARLSAGNGSFETSADSDRRYAFRSDFLRRKGNVSAMVLMRVAGDSMEPEIMDNDVVLVDTANIIPKPGRLYAVAVEDMVYLKKVNAEPGKLVLTSANAAYSPLEIDARGDQVDGIRIIGKAVWVGRELD